MLDYWVDTIEKTFDDSIEAHKIADVRSARSLLRCRFQL